MKKENSLNLQRDKEFITIYSVSVARDQYGVVPRYGRNRKERRKMSKTQAELEYFPSISRPYGSLHSQLFV